MRDIFKVIEQIRNVLGEDNEYSEIKASLEDLEYRLGFKAPELVWDYTYIVLITKFIPPKTEIDYQVLSVWTTKSVEELKESDKWKK